MRCITSVNELQCGGRPVGDVHRALMVAAAELVEDGKAPTLLELVQRACVGYKSARMTVQNLTRCGALAKVRERRVAYRNRPVAEYAPSYLVQPAANDGVVAGFDFSALTRAW